LKIFGGSARPNNAGSGFQPDPITFDEKNKKTRHQQQFCFFTKTQNIKPL
jgi:hypothetical protein